MASETPTIDTSDISPISIVDEMKTSYLDYAMSVIVARALPDVRDGLKPVHRRILYACQEGGFVPGRPYRKSAKIVGDVMGNYHPHGDSAIYDALARMTQDWSMRVPLIDGQGNFGSMDPDPPASMRYTEARLAKVAMTSPRLCGGMLVAMPTAMPPAPLTSRLGKRAGRTCGSSRDAS